MDTDIVRQKRAYDSELSAWMEARHILKRLGGKQLAAMQLQSDEKAAQILSRLKWLSHSANSLAHHYQHKHMTKMVTTWREQTQHCLRVMEARMHHAAHRLQSAMKAWSVRVRMCLVHTTLESLDPERNEMLRALEMGVGKRRARDVITAWMLGAVARVKVDNIKEIIADRSKPKVHPSQPRRHSRSGTTRAASPRPVRYLSDPSEEEPPSHEPPLIYAQNKVADSSPRRGVYVVHCAPRQAALACRKSSPVRWDAGSVVML